MTADSWDEYADDWDANPDARLYSERAFEAFSQTVLPLVSNPCGAHVLDFGCGTGLLTEKITPLCGSVVAVDTSAKMIDVLRKKVIENNIDNVTAIVATVGSASMNSRPELADKFDLILASSVCSFLPDYESTLADIVSLMQPGGIFAQWDWLDHMSVKRIDTAFRASGLVNLGTEQVFEMTTADDSAPVVMGVARLPV